MPEIIVKTIDSIRITIQDTWLLAQLSFWDTGSVSTITNWKFLETTTLTSLFSGEININKSLQEK